MPSQGFNIRVVTARASCPNCGAQAAPGRGSCARCGFAIVEESLRLWARPSRAAVLATALAVGGALVLVLGLATLQPDDEAPEGPDPVPARAAEWQLERSLFDFRDDDSAAIACPRAIGSFAPTRCRVRYPSGAVRGISVRVSPVGTLEVLTP
jgi:hypothetical protein